MTGGQIGVLLMNATALPLVAFLGNGDDHAGFIYTAITFAIISCALTLFAFKNIREMDTDKIQHEPKLPMKKSFAAMKGNWPWILMVLANLIFWIALQQRNTTIVYYLTYNLDRKDLVPLINSLATIQILFIIAIPFFSKYLAKTWIWVGGLLVATFGGVMMWLAADNITFLIAAWILGNIGSGIACSMPFAMLGFAVDFTAWIMNSFDYVPNHAQSATGLEGIIWAPALLFALAAIPLLFFRKYEAMEEKIRHDLETINS